MNEDNDLSESDSPDEFLFVWACGFELAIGVLALVLASIFQVDARAYLPKWEDIDAWSLLKDTLIGILAAIPALVVIHVVMKWKIPAIEALHRLSEVPMMQSLMSLRPAELIVLSFCAGVGEEIFFRGFLLPWITSISNEVAGSSSVYEIGGSFGSAPTVWVAAALLLSSIAFGLVHPITKAYIVIASIMGLYLGAVFLATESLMVVIVAHAAYDAVQFMLAKWSVDTETEDTLESTSSTDAP